MSEAKDVIDGVRLELDSLERNMICLEMECDALRKDALRYRWLRAYGPKLFVDHVWPHDTTFDYAIDAELEK